jgi:hypothetical protein
MLPVLRLKDQMFCCLHWRDFPPNILFLDGEPDQIWKEGRISHTEYQRYEVWKQKCGMKTMTATCLSCDMIRRLDYRNHLPVMMTLDGKQIVPITDSTTMEMFPKNRGNIITGIEGNRGDGNR